jgi:hypothetical protein
MRKGYNDLNNLREKRGQTPVSKGQYMILTYGDRWNSEESAARAWNKVVHKQTSGKQFDDYGNTVGPAGPRTIYTQDDNGNIVSRRDLSEPLIPSNRLRRVGSTSTGYWKVNVTFIYPNDDGSPDLDPEALRDNTRSFTVYSRKHTDFGNKQYVEEMLQDVIEFKVIDWRQTSEYGEGIPDGWINYAVEVFPVQGSSYNLGPTEAASPEAHYNKEVVVLEDLVI